jgi:two-component system sensor histidine kinase/response regulator
MLKTFSWNELSDKAKGYFNTIRQNSNRQLKLVNNILDITKINAGSFEVHKTNSDIVQLTKLIIESIEPYADRKKINVLFSFAPAEMIIGIDEEKYERILLNLLSNAIKYTPKGESITVKLSKNIVKNKAMACIQVCDNGIGIPVDKQGLIFERFGQVDSVLSRQTEGTGIGLHLTRMFVEMLGGEIKIDSKLGTGSTFTFLLPAVKVKETHTEKMAHELADNRTIQLTDIEFSDIYLDKQ